MAQRPYLARENWQTFAGTEWSGLTKHWLCLGPVQPPAQNKLQHCLGSGPKHRPCSHWGEQLILENFWQFSGPGPQQPPSHALSHSQLFSASVELYWKTGLAPLPSRISVQLIVLMWHRLKLLKMPTLPLRMARKMKRQTRDGCVKTVFKCQSDDDEPKLKMIH